MAKRSLETRTQLRKVLASREGRAGSLMNLATFLLLACNEYEWNARTCHCNNNREKLAEPTPPPNPKAFVNMVHACTGSETGLPFSRSKRVELCVKGTRVSTDDSTFASFSAMPSMIIVSEISYNVIDLVTILLSCVVR